MCWPTGCWTAPCGGGAARGDGCASRAGPQGGRGGHPALPGAGLLAAGPRPAAGARPGGTGALRGPLLVESMAALLLELPVESELPLPVRGSPFVGLPRAEGAAAVLDVVPAGRLTGSRLPGSRLLSAAGDGHVPALAARLLPGAVAGGGRRVGAGGAAADPLAARPAREPGDRHRGGPGLSRPWAVRAGIARPALLAALQLARAAGEGGPFRLRTGAGHGGLLVRAGADGPDADAPGGDRDRPAARRDLVLAAQPAPLAAGAAGGGARAG